MAKVSTSKYEAVCRERDIYKSNLDTASGYLRYFVDWLDREGLIEDGSFTMPDGATFWTTAKHEAALESHRRWMMDGPTEAEWAAIDAITSTPPRAVPESPDG